MNANALRSYRFSTAAQWSVCLFDRAGNGRAGLRPVAPFVPTATLYGTRGGHAPAVTRSGEVLWRDDAGTLYRLDPCAAGPEASSAPLPIARAARMIATSRGVWAGTQLFEEETLARLLAVELRDRVHDIAGDGRGGIFALVERGEVWRAVHIDCAGQIAETVAFDGIAHVDAFVFLRRAQRFVVLAGQQRQCLHWFSARGGAALRSIPIGALRPCFIAHALGSDGRDHIFVAGDGDGAYVVTLDADGNVVGEVPLEARDAPATGIVAARGRLFVTGPRGLLRFTTAAAVPDNASEVRCAALTPMLQSPDREDGRRWLRVEATATLPEGAAIEIAVAATDDAEVRGRLAAIAADASLSPRQRIQKLRGEPEVWRAPVVFHGGASAAAPFVAPLFDVRERYLWVSVVLSAAPGARLPELSELAVLYPGRTLMDNLPAIYQRAEAQPGSFLRGLVGVLEATTQGLDARIAAMGSRIDPSSAPEPWLDFVARWLGLPWDDAFTLEQKKAILRRAPELAKGRGTRAGLEALLDSVTGGPPRRFRVTDATADFGFAVAGGALPAILGGRTRWSAELDSRTILGYTRLPCPGQRDDGAWQLAGKIRIEVAATAEERKAWEPWLLALIAEMVPLTARLDLRWVGAHALRGDRLGGPLALEAPPVPHLGTGAVTGLAQLPERAVRLTALGLGIGTRLR
jgi:phage tail-like protein